MTNLFQSLLLKYFDKNDLLKVLPPYTSKNLIEYLTSFHFQSICKLPITQSLSVNLDNYRTNPYKIRNYFD